MVTRPLKVAPPKTKPKSKRRARQSDDDVPKSKARQRSRASDDQNISINIHVHDGKEEGAYHVDTEDRQQRARSPSRDSRDRDSSARADEEATGSSAEDDTEWNVDNKCVFCWHVDATFHERSLVEHYWESCPMLTPCPACNKIVEVSSYTSHLLDVCKKKGMFKRCPRCKECVRSNEYPSHVAVRSCHVAKDEARFSRCPLCHSDIAPGRDAWRTHLMEDTCPANEERNVRYKELVSPGSTRPPPREQRGARGRGRGRGARGRGRRRGRA